MPLLLHEDLSHKILGAFYEVHRELGHGFSEPIYQRALERALRDRTIAFEREKPLAVYFRGEIVGEYRVDLLVSGVIIVELKAVERLSPAFENQVINYLTATRLELGLLLNFGQRAQFKRLVRSIKSDLRSV